VEGIIAAGTVTAITGESGCGKTTLITAICGAVNRGVTFASLATQQRPILMLDRENPLPIVCERFERLDVQDGESFIVWGGWAQDEPPAPNSRIVREWVVGCNPKPLIVVDSLIAFSGCDENDATAMRAHMQGYRRLADLGATVILIHHSGKSETAKDYRGSSDIKASIDVGYNLANTSEPSRLGAMRLRAFKARFSVQPELIVRYQNGRFRQHGSGTAAVHQDILRGLLTAHPAVRTAEFEALAVENGVRRKEAREFLAAGALDGTVRVEPRPHNAQLHTWIGADADELRRGRRGVICSLPHSKENHCLPSVPAS
jgi:RecA-family ATPase